MSSYACGGVDKLMEFFVVLIISEIDPSHIEQLVVFFLNMCLIGSLCFVYFLYSSQITYFFFLPTLFLTGLKSAKITRFFLVLI